MQLSFHLSNMFFGVNNSLQLNRYGHGGDFTPVRKTQKTYGIFFDTIFFGGSKSMVVTDVQYIATHKIFKIAKTRLQSIIFIFQPPVFLTKRPKKGLFFCQH